MEVVRAYLAAFDARGALVNEVDSRAIAFGSGVIPADFALLALD